MFDETTFLASPTGATLNLYVQNAGPSPRAIVQISHGLAEHAERYARLAERLASHGVSTYVHDHRGHGGTRAPDAPQGVFAASAGAARVVDDVLAVHDRIALDHPGVPVIAFGHSMGGLVALNFMLKHSGRLAGAAIWNANVSAGLLGRAARAILAWERFRLGSDMPSRLLPQLTFRAWAKSMPVARTAFDWLSRDPAEVDKYVADPLCGWDASVSMWRDVFDLIFTGADNRAYDAVRRDLPLNILGGEADPATDGGKATRHLARRLTAMGFSNLTSEVYAETRHESLNEVNRDIITDGFIAWVDRAIRHT